MKKGQASIEMMFVVGMLFFVLLMILGFIFNKRIEINQQNRIVETKNDCIKLSNLIVNAFLSGNYTRIETTIDFDSSVNMKKSVITIDDFVTCTIPLRYNDESLIAEIDLDKGNIVVENKNNVVFLKTG